MKTGQESWVRRVMRNMSCITADAVEEQSSAQREEQEVGNKLYYKTETIYRRKDGVAASCKYKMVTLEMIATGLSNDIKTMFYACPLTKENVQELHVLQQNNSMMYFQYAASEGPLAGRVAIDDVELIRLKGVALRMQKNGKEDLYSKRIEWLQSVNIEEAQASHKDSVSNKRQVHPVIGACL